MSVKVFILEDDNSRIAQFKDAGAGADLVIAEDIESGLRLFDEHGPFDFAFLDHDLGGKAFVSSTERNTGSEFCRQRAEALRPLRAVIIHSWNPVGAGEMENILGTARQEPFGPTVLGAMRYLASLCCTGINGSHTAGCDKNGERLVCHCCNGTFSASQQNIEWSTYGSACAHCATECSDTCSENLGNPLDV